MIQAHNNPVDPPPGSFAALRGEKQYTPRFQCMLYTLLDTTCINSHTIDIAEMPARSISTIGKDTIIQGNTEYVAKDSASYPFDFLSLRTNGETAIFLGQRFSISDTSGYLKLTNVLQALESQQALGIANPIFTEFYLEKFNGALRLQVWFYYYTNVIMYSRTWPNEPMNSIAAILNQRKRALQYLDSLLAANPNAALDSRTWSRIDTSRIYASEIEYR